MSRTLLFLFAVIFSFGLSAQTIHEIEAGGGPGGPTPYYAPQFITIEVGDIVRWTNSGGTHNVDGSSETFPNNPEGFINGPPSNTLWEFEHTFTIVGFYEFECAAFDHADTQFGNITVVDSSVGIEELKEETLDIYPNPVVDLVNISIDGPITSIRVYDIEMKELMRFEFTGLESKESLDLSALDAATYLLEVNTSNGIIYRRFLKD